MIHTDHDSRMTDNRFDNMFQSSTCLHSTISNSNGRTAPRKENLIVYWGKNAMFGVAEKLKRNAEISYFRESWDTYNAMKRII